MTLYIYRMGNGSDGCDLDVVAIQESDSWKFEFHQTPIKDGYAYKYSFIIRCGHGDWQANLVEVMEVESFLSKTERVRGLSRVKKAISTQITSNRYLDFDDVIAEFLIAKPHSCT